MSAKQCRLWMFVLIVMSILGMAVQAQDNIHMIVYDNIRFSFPSSLATGIQIEAVETNPLSRPEEQFWAGTYPEHIRFNFLNYLDESQFLPPYLIEGAQLLVYSTDSMRDFGYDFIDQPAALRALLQELPDLSTYAGAWDGRSEEGLYLPFLPWINSAQMLRSHPQYVEIAGVGSGIRYLTRYSQESAAHITDQQIFYTFQGIMADGAYYVSAVFPVKTGVLPEVINTSNIDWDTFAANYGAYLAETFAQINSLQDEDFYPDLNTLDNLIQSIAFETESAAWQSYTNVTAGFRFQYPPERQICAFENNIELIESASYYDNPDADHCSLAYQANPISIIFSEDDTAFQDFRAENYPGSFVDFQEEVISIGGQSAVRISGTEVETALPFQLIRIDRNGSYLIIRAIGEENIGVLNDILVTLHFMRHADS